MQNTSLVVAILALCITLPASASQRPGPEENLVLNVAEGVALSAKIQLPTTAPRAAFVILPGSGNVGTDGDVSSPFVGFGYKGQPAKLSDQLSATLAETGSASLRYAKRGVENVAELAHQTAPYLVADAHVALQALKQRFPGIPVGFVGFSEGALVATMVAAEEPVDFLFLLAPPSRSMDDMLAYQFLQWPVDLLRRKLDANGDGELNASELATLDPSHQLPLLGLLWGADAAKWENLDVNQSCSLSFDAEIAPTYAKFLGTAMSVIRSPSFAGWYTSFRDLPAFSTFASRITAPVYMYQGMEDAQVNWSWAVSSQQSFAGKTSLRFFEGLGHAFAPMEGAIGEVKTSGPFSSTLLEALAQDVKSAL